MEKRLFWHCNEKGQKIKGGKWSSSDKEEGGKKGKCCEKKENVGEIGRRGGKKDKIRRSFVVVVQSLFRVLEAAATTLCVGEKRVPISFSRKKRNKNRFMISAGKKGKIHVFILTKEEIQKLHDKFGHGKKKNMFLRAFKNMKNH